MTDVDLPESEAPSATVSPFELLGVLWRRRLIVLGVFAVSVVVASGLSLRSPKQYSSTAQLLFREPGFAQALFGNGLFQSNGPEEPQRTTQTNIDVVTSLSVAAKARSELGSNDSPESLAKSVSVTPSSNANIANIQATRSSPGGAAALANAFANGYISYRRETDRALVAQAEELVSQSLSHAAAAERPKLEESLRQLRVLRSLQTGNGEVIAYARPDSAPVSPKPTRDALLGGVLGLLLGCALALLVDYLDRRLKTMEDLERAYGGYPVIASIPHVDGVASDGFAAEGAVGEAYRILRENLRFFDPRGEACCFLITSAEEGEGKSTVAVNLAMALAAVGRRALLVEADMRRPAAAAQLGVRSRVHGLSDLLISNDSVEDCIASAAVDPNLAVLPSGTMPPNPADLLSAGRMSEILASVREAADVVIIDSPPLLPVADTRVLIRMPEIDGVVVVGRAGVSQRDRVRAARRILDQSGRKIFGLVVTGLKTSLESDYYYGERRSSERSSGGSSRHRQDAHEREHEQVQPTRR
ncbi:MAG TPA: polysaccharide biosynthesis tyrosine autokinase [Solirubrobacteraceae bacterium]|nr:polysaccharide biosynthesis tyrosine autokinase [Solirubrobacteraceae bacterium]